MQELQYLGQRPEETHQDPEVQPPTVSILKIAQERFAGDFHISYLGRKSVNVQKLFVNISVNVQKLLSSTVKTMYIMTKKVTSSEVTCCKVTAPLLHL